jgi:hypothetical protein
MKVGDKVRDKARGLIGTVIGAEAKRVFIQADAVPGNSGPTSRVWQNIDQVELVDMSGKPVQGSPAQSLNATGAQVNAAARSPSSGPAESRAAPVGAGENYDTSGNRIEMH